MKGTKSRVGIVVSLMILAAIIASCVSSPAPASTPKDTGTQNPAVSPTTKSQLPTIKIGMVTGFTGTAAFNSASARDGIRLAIEEINAKGGLLGRQVELLTRDDQLKPELAVSLAKDLILRDKVDFFLGNVSSGAAAAESQLLNEQKKLSVSWGASSSQLVMSLGNRYYFSVNPNSYMESQAGVPVFAKLPYTKYGIIAPDYQWGHDMYNDFTSALTKARPDVKITVQQWPKLNEVDYTPYINALMAADIEVLWSGEWGADFAAFAKQAKPYGLFKKVKLFSGLLTADNLMQLGDAADEGWLAWSGRGEFWAFPGDAMKQFTEKYRVRYGTYPDCYPVLGYDAFTAIVEAVKKAGTTETEAVVNAMEGMTYDSLRGRLTIRPVDHQANCDFYLGYTHKDPQYPFYTTNNLVLVKGDTTLPSEQMVLDSRKKK